MYGAIVNHNKKANWIKNIKDIYKNNEALMYEDITIEKIINALKRTRKWKSPGTYKKKQNFSFTTYLPHINKWRKLFQKSLKNLKKKKKMLD